MGVSGGGDGPPHFFVPGGHTIICPPSFFDQGGTDSRLSPPLFVFVKRKIFVSCPWDFHFLKQKIMISDKCFSNHIIFVTLLNIFFFFLAVSSIIYDSKGASTLAIYHQDESIYRMRSYEKWLINMFQTFIIFQRSPCVKSLLHDDKSHGDYFQPLEVILFFHSNIKNTGRIAVLTDMFD